MQSLILTRQIVRYHELIMKSLCKALHLQGEAILFSKLDALFERRANALHNQHYSHDGLQKILSPAVHHVRGQPRTDNVGRV